MSWVYQTTATCALALGCFAESVAGEAATGPEPGREAGFLVRDTRAFLELLDQEDPGLSMVRAALARGDVDAAGAAYANRFRNRSIESPLLTDWAGMTRNGAHNTSRADGLIAGHFWDGYSIYEVPPSGFDWHGSPLSCVTRFPVLRTLQYAIHHTQDRKYVRFAVEHILGYLDAYPVEEFVGKATTQGWTNHTTVAKPWYWCMLPTRLSALAETVALIRGSPHVTDAELLRILRRMYQEAGYLRTEIKPWVVDRRHNGGGAMIEAMAESCAVLADFPPTRDWLAFDAELAAHYIREAFYPDGMCVELTTAYSASVSQTQQGVAFALRDQDAIRGLRDRLTAMITCLVALSDPAGQLPSFGDLYAGKVSGNVHGGLVDWLDMPWVKDVTHGAGGPPPTFTVWPVPGQDQWCGYYTMRSDWTPLARYMAVDGGPWGTTHRHGDRLSFVVTALGARFIIDPSSTRYASNQPDAFIGGQPSGFLHNTITVDGVDEFMAPGIASEAKKPLLNHWEHRARSTLFAASFSFRPVKPVTWERRILFVDGRYWLLQDVLTAEQGQGRIERNFQFEADIEVSFSGRTTIASAPNGARLVLIPLDDSLTPALTIGDTTPHTTYWPNGKPTQVLRQEDGHDQKHGRGWTGRSTHKLMPAPAVTYVGDASFPAVMTMAIVPLSPGQGLEAAPTIDASQEGDRTTWLLPGPNGVLRFVTSVGECAVTE